MRHNYTQDTTEEQTATPTQAYETADLALGPVEDGVTIHVDHNASYLTQDKELSANIIPNRRAPNKPIPVFTEKQIKRFWSKVQKTDGCWLWTGAQIYANPAKTIFYGIYCGLKAHRVAYVLQKGPIPDGHTVDHVKSAGCVSTLCVRGEHLDAVTQQEQIIRRDEGRIVGGMSICKWGHIRPAGRYAKCAECAKRFSRESQKRFREKPRTAEELAALRAVRNANRKRQRAAAKELAASHPYPREVTP